ncbi:MAG: hypothetical protein M0R33_00250 [Methylomonas sp.]|jgi:hypothetical protein|uniref:NACHT domain-containing protein n=1 Tax=Methylomonas sp. TaxID=418 RepID=UPI0025D1FDD0|nr:hypothetical protein [Methylomonas sp.]MCK9604864.1 hypothetical protein [Methylomonas sp.]
MEKYIPLQRQFSPISGNQEDSESNEFLSFWGNTNSKSWDDLDQEYRSVILAAAGAGKTEELRHRANELLDQGKLSFFIRIEDIENSFWQAFEIGEETQFEAWLQSTAEAWFFLDSVDEARLDNSRTFERALRHFARTIKQGAHRAHIYFSSRPYAWRFSEDCRILDEILFVPKLMDKANEGKQHPESESALTVYSMLPLNHEKIRRFCLARGTHDIDQLMQEIDRCNLGSLAERPFDLESILSKWAKDKALGGRLELLRHNIDQRLRDTHNTDRAQRQPLNLEQAKEGARRLAAAVVLSGQVGLNVPDSSSDKPGIEAGAILGEWDLKDVRALLERGIFNDILYGAVRFRHREVRELLAAEWFDSLLKKGNSRQAIESLFFREQYGEKIIAPRLRPVLPWLILFDDGIRLKALQIIPEIPVEGGDPSKLPLPERQNILRDIVHRIAANQDDRSARDNSAIARIAKADLSDNALRLINEYQNNDEAIFFLGRFVWQGNLVGCLEPLRTIALDITREKYARIASVRAVMTCGTEEQKQNLWRQLNGIDAFIPRELLAEIVDGAEPNSNSIEQLLISIGKLERYDEFNPTGLEDVLHEFVAKLPADGGAAVIVQLIDGLHRLLVIPPFVECGNCHVSEAYAWLLSIATHAVERLVERRNAAALEATIISVLLMVPALRYWGHSQIREHQGDLRTLVPDWPELNDALYWASIEQARLNKAAKSTEPLTDELSVLWRDHYFMFDATSFPRLLGYMESRKLQDDRLIALNAAFRIFVQAGRPKHMLTGLKKSAAANPVLQNRLDMLLDPPVSEQSKQLELEVAKSQREREERDEQQKRNRDRWITELRANPDRIITSANLKPGELTGDQYWLLRELRGEGLMISHSEAADWRTLIPDFGEAVAHAYREAAINYWRSFVPTMQSEGAIRDNSVPCGLIFAMAGLEIEANETTDFPYHLSNAEVRHALRYITWELNGFPRWFEKMHHAFPESTIEAVTKEILWELENTDSEQPMHYILDRVAYNAPWLYSSIAPAILSWVLANPGRINANQHYCLQILAKGGASPERLEGLANQELANTRQLEHMARWHALRVDCAPDNGIPEVERWLASLLTADAKHAAQIFITALMGGSWARDRGPYVGSFRTAEHLKSLYVLMHRHIQVKEDIERANKGTYSRGLRDDAQDARNRLFNLITEIPGKASYIAIKQLIDDHPAADYRPWMAKRAYQRAEADGDLESWTASQVFDFAQSQTNTPTTHRQLFNLAVQHLTELKNWLERGNDSAWKTWRRAEQETEMRTLIAGWLNQRCQSHYVTAQEPELANSQRMDIWLHSTYVKSPVPIELKLLDKDWSGNDLCERLRNQLAGDYLREETAGCGVLLLVAQNIGQKKYWIVNGKNVVLTGLADALKNYWQGISDQYPGVLAIDVIVIDLAERGRVSDS